MYGPTRSLRGHAAGLAVALSVNVVLPLLTFDYAAPRSGDTVALLASSVPPLLWSTLEFVYRRRVDALSLLIVAGLALSVLATTGGGSARFLQLREHLVTAVIGLVFLGSAAVGRPLVYQLARAGLLRTSPEQVTAFEAKRDTPRFRRIMTIMTLVWGIGLFASAALACVLVFALSTRDNVIVSPFLSYGVVSALALWTAWYRRHSRAHAAGLIARTNRNDKADGAGAGADP